MTLSQVAQRQQFFGHYTGRAAPRATPAQRERLITLSQRPNTQPAHVVEFLGSMADIAPTMRPIHQRFATGRAQVVMSDAVTGAAMAPNMPDHLFVRPGHSFDAWTSDLVTNLATLLPLEPGVSLPPLCSGRAHEAWQASCETYVRWHHALAHTLRLQVGLELGEMTDQAFSPIVMPQDKSLFPALRREGLAGVASRIHHYLPSNHFDAMIHGTLQAANEAVRAGFSPARQAWSAPKLTSSPAITRSAFDDLADARHHLRYGLYNSHVRHGPLARRERSRAVTLLNSPVRIEDDLTNNMRSLLSVTAPQLASRLLPLLDNGRIHFGFAHELPATGDTSPLRWTMDIFNLWSETPSEAGIYVEVGTRYRDALVYAVNCMAQLDRPQTLFDALTYQATSDAQTAARDLARALCSVYTRCDAWGWTAMMAFNHEAEQRGFQAWSAGPLLERAKALMLRTDIFYVAHQYETLAPRDMMERLHQRMLRKAKQRIEQFPGEYLRPL